MLLGFSTALGLMEARANSIGADPYKKTPGFLAEECGQESLG